jgi:hypothetical protein
MSSGVSAAQKQDEKSIALDVETSVDNSPAEPPSGNLSAGWTTTRLELWSFYLYYVGNNGLSGFNFGPSQFQNLLYLAGYDPSEPPYDTPCGDNGCVLPYLGKVRSGK